MNKSLFMMAAFIYILSFFACSALATSWVQLDPQEVSNRAEIIVLGKYDFKSKLEESKEIFAGYEFKVEKVFRGSANETIIAGIDRFDVSWAVESQEEDGKFLLFLQRSPETDFLVPVGGPNGMIQVREGVANGADKAFYQKFLNSAAKEPVNQIEDEKKMSTMNKIIAAGSGLAFVLFIGIKLKRRTLKK